MTDPLTRIADALELMALAHTYDVSECPAMAQIRRRIEARHSAPTVSVPVLPTTDAGNAFVDGLLTHGAPPPDDDPEWRDVPAEESPIRSLRKGDRWFLQLTQKWEIHTGSALPWTDSRWIKRHDHPARKPVAQTVDGLGSKRK